MVQKGPAIWEICEAHLDTLITSAKDEAVNGREERSTSRLISPRFVHSHNGIPYVFPNSRKDCGLERFVPSSYVDSMKRKELRKILSHFLKLNSNLTAPGQKQLTALQAKLHYLKIISELPSYGAKCFSTNMKVRCTSGMSRNKIVCHNSHFL